MRLWGFWLKVGVALGSLGLRRLKLLDQAPRDSIIIGAQQAEKKEQ